MKQLTPALAAVLALGLSACTPPAEAPADAPAAPGSGGASTCTREAVCACG